MAKATKTKQQMTDVGGTRQIWLAALGAIRLAERSIGDAYQSLVQAGAELEPGLMDSLKSVRDKMEETYNSAVTKLEGATGEAGQALSTAATQGTGALEKSLESTLKRMGVPTTAEVEALKKRIDAISERLNELKTAKPAGAKAKTAAKPAKSAGNKAQGTAASA